MADYTDYNPSTGNKGVIVALVLLTALIVGLIWIGINAPGVVEGQDAIAPATGVETAPATGDIAPAITE